MHKEARVVVVGIDTYEKMKLSKSNIPLLIVEGKSDNNRFSGNPEILKFFSNGKLITINNAGHMINMEQPGIFNKVITDFINSNISHK